jgi:FAD/FMN-containing dehydrogenase
MTTDLLWQNFYRNLSCRPSRIAHPASEEEIIEELEGATARGESVRIAGAGHSNVPLVCTDDVLVRLDRMAGVRKVDAAARLVTLGPGTPIAALGDELWEHGLALENQGDIDTQHIAGAIATGTHGTGIGLVNFSGKLRAARHVTASGEVLVCGDRTDGADEVLPIDALRTSLGLLGVMSELTIAVRDAYCVERTWLTMSWEEFGEQWQELLRSNRHFTFFWNPYDDSSTLFGLPPAPGQSVLVKLMNEVPADAELRGNGRHSDPEPNVDRSYRIFADDYDPYFAELEYMVPVADTIAAMSDVCALMRDVHPGERWPVEVRFTAGDPGWLSPSHDRETCVISCCGDFRAEYEPFLRDVDRVLANYDARPHWGKIHYFDAPRLERVFPKLPAFRRVRDRLDPDGLFVNDWLRPVVEGE